MLYLFAILFISATLAKGGKGKGRGGGSKGKGSGCTVPIEEQNNNLDTFLAPFTSDSQDDSTTCLMEMKSSSWPHVDAAGATRRLLGSDTEVAFDVSGKVVSQLQVTVDETSTCLTTTTFAVSSVVFNYAVEVEESMAEEVSAEDSDCDSDSEDATEEPTEGDATEETTEGDATEDNDLIPIRRNLGDSEESNRAYAVVTLTQTNDNSVSFDLTVQCDVRYSEDDEGTCTPAEMKCRHGDYSYNVAGEGAELELVEAYFSMECAVDDSSDICPVA